MPGGTEAADRWSQHRAGIEQPFSDLLPDVRGASSRLVEAAKISLGLAYPKKEPLEGAGGGHGCTYEEAEGQAEHFSRAFRARPQGWLLGCAEPVQLERYLAATWPAAENLTFINIGANKGYNLVKWLAHWAPQYGVDPARWGAFLRTRYGQAVFDKWRLCGVCNDCKEPTPRRWRLRAAGGGRPAGRARPRKAAAGLTVAPSAPRKGPRMFAVEPSDSSYDLLRHLQLWADYPRLTVLHMAGSNSSGFSKFPQTRVGNEVHWLGANSSQGWGSTHVRVATVDELVREHRLGRIDILKIDTEGFDPLVLQGAAQTLAARQVALLEFEYHGINHWAATPLRGIVEQLDGQGFECFLKSFSELGSYVRLTGCFHEHYEFHRWSNVVCSHRAEAAEVTLFLLSHCRWL